MISDRAVLCYGSDRFSSAVTLAGDHDKVRPYGGDSGENKFGITQDKAMAYAFILISEGLPMVAYNDYFLGAYVSLSGTGWSGPILTNEIDRLIDARRQFVGGTNAYLSTAYTNDLFIMKRTGSTNRPGCILVLNDNPSLTLTNTVNTDWANTNLVDFINTSYTVTTYGVNGSASLSAPPRGYRVFVRQGDM